MEELTKGEEQIMLLIWQLEKCFVKEIISELPNPKPAYNTVSTIVRILEKKKFVNHLSFGKTHQYYPVMDKNEYMKLKTSGLVSSFFNGSFESMLSFFVKEKQLNLTDIDELLKELKK